MPWILGFFLWYAIPMAASLWFSFTDYDLVSDEPMQFVGLENWVRLFNDADVHQSVLVTLKFGAIALPVAILFPMAIAYLLVAKSLKGREGFRALFFMPSIIPFVAAVLVFNGVFNGQIGWVNKILAIFGIDGPEWFYDEFWIYPSLVFIGLWAVGNAILIFIAAMKGVPSDLYAAARIDDAGEWGSFRHITVPFTTPIIFY
ncbi:MAG TPA: sugar ABC transporter permease, partial [Acidimicrobiia bacterium]|nr:sugar ABC transporter permease [Acidimicrobiia bacterium]